MRLIGLRHGQSRFNLAGLCNDDDARRVGLTALGRRQARSAAQTLRAEPVSKIYSSPLLRARQTAGIVAASLELSVTVDPRLADIRSGFDGRPVAEYLSAIAGDPFDTRVNGGESLRDYQKRIAGFLGWLHAGPNRTAAGQAVLLVVHEETLRMIDAWCNGLSLGDVVGKAFDNSVPHYFQSANAN